MKIKKYLNKTNQWKCKKFLVQMKTYNYLKIQIYITLKILVKKLVRKNLDETRNYLLE